jgi:hypothetical protein
MNNVEDERAEAQSGSSEEDLFVSFTFAASIEGSVSGLQAYIAVLSTLAPTWIPPQLVAFTQATFAKIQRWFDTMGQGRAIVSSEWNRPESFEAQDGMQVVDQLIQINRDLVAQADALSVRHRLSDEEVRVTIALWARCVANDKSHVERLLLFGDLRRDELMVESMRHHYDQTIPENQKAVDLFQMIQNNAYKKNPDFIQSIADILSELPRRTRVHLHQLRVLRSVYDEFTFETAEIPHSIARKWQALGFSAEQASQWSAQLISPEEALSWRQVGFAELDTIIPWRRAGFNVMEAEMYKKQGLSIEEARIQRLRP